MRFSPFLVLNTLTAFSLVMILAACGGGSSKSKSPTSTLSLSPTTISLNKGEVQQLSTTAKNSAGTQIFPTITYSTSDPNIANVSTSGSICGGTWDSSFIVCTPQNSGTATITATADGVTATATVNVHDRITRILVNPPSPPCISQNQTQTFTVQVFSGNVDISSTPGVAGTFAFTIADSNIGSIDSGSGVVTAKNSGATNVSGSITGLVSPVTPTPAVFVTCPPKTISLHVDQASDTSFSLNLSDTTTKQLAADVIDTLGNGVSGLSLTYTSNQPATASISSAGLVTAVGAGNATFVASCTPPSCNPGLSGASTGLAGSGQAVYSNVALGTVSGTSTSTAYAASTASTNLIPIPTDSNTPGTAITLPQTPSSFVWNRQGTKAYLGSGGGLMVFDPSSNSVTVAQSDITGKVLAVSLDGNKVLIANDTTVFVYDVGRNSFESFSQVPNSLAADFPEDSSKAFIISATKLGIYVPGASFMTMPLTSANDVSFIAQGAAGFIAASPQSNAFATCRNAPVTMVPPATLPSSVLVKALPTGTRLIAAGTSWLDVGYTINPPSGIACPPSLNVPTPMSVPFVGITSVPAGSTLQVTPDSSRVFLTYQSGTSTTTTGIPFFNTVTRTAGAITLVGAGAAFTGGTTLDSQNLYVGSSGDNKVHLIRISSSSDTQQIAVTDLHQSDGSQAKPDLVTVRPK